jgi:ribosomal protein S18 acetylase RimI-like enzyme
MPSAQPAGDRLRAPTVRDAKGVAALRRAREQADLGVPESSAEDVRAEWEGVDLEHDAWLVEGGPAGVAAYALVSGADVLVAVHPAVTGYGYGTLMRATAERRAHERGFRVVRQFVPGTDTAARVLLLEAGWWPVHHYFRLRAELRQVSQPPSVLTRRFAPERDAEEVWHLVQGAYAGVEGFLRQSLEGWLATGVEKPDFDPDLWLLLHDAKGIVGAALGERGGRGESRTGLITTVTVAPRARGRGQGRTLVALLLAAFRAKKLRYAEAAAHGPTAAAARVFESAGMQVVRTTERWEKVVGV